MKKLAMLFILAFVLSACGPNPQQIASALSSTMTAVPTMTSYPTLKPYPTYTLYPTYTAYPSLTPAPTHTTVVIVVTATETPTLEYTPTITNTPGPTKDPTQLDKEAGFYLVGQDIAPGLWRSTGDGGKCYWAITTKTGDINSNHYGMAGGTMYIPATGFQVELGDGCGTFIYIGQ